MLATELGYVSRKRWKPYANSPIAVLLSARKVFTFHPQYPDTGPGLGLSTKSSVSQRYSTVAGHSINSCPYYRGWMLTEIGRSVETV